MPLIQETLRSQMELARMGLRMVARLPGYLRSPLTLAQARATLASRLERRDRDFLDLARQTIFANPKSPYLALFRLAGCEFGDLVRLVERAGLEGTLDTLYRSGIYLSLDEFKGRRPAVRGSGVVTVNPSHLRNPLATAHMWAATGGSRGPGTPLALDLASLRDRAVNMYLALDARGGATWHTAVWGTPGLGPMLWYSLCGGPIARWFSVLDPQARALQLRYRWSVRTVRWTSRLAMVPLPKLEHAPLDAPLPIARWIEQAVRAGEVPHLWASVSSAVRLCQAARQERIDLGGARFTVTGEPVTEARLAVLRRAGVDAVPDYGSVDSGGSMTCACLAPETPDDVHFFDDLHALLQVTEPPLPARALLVSSLRATTPLILFNVCLGDRAVVTTRHCGCAVQRLGLRTHLHTIRSYEKLTAGGMTFIDSDVIRVLEEVLPAAFGGGPTDYQLAEEEGDDAQPVVRLLVHPAVGPIDSAAVVRAFLAAIGPGSGTERKMALLWGQGGFLRVDRQVPRITSAAKILHLSATQRNADESSGR